MGRGRRGAGEGRGRGVEEKGAALFHWGAAADPPQAPASLQLEADCTWSRAVQGTQVQCRDTSTVQGHKYSAARQVQ